LTECPDGFEDLFDECQCNLMHYKNENDETICTEKCPKERSLIADKKLCVEKCTEVNSTFPYYFEGVCYPNCSIIPYKGLKEKKIDSANDEEKTALKRYDKFSEFICLCEGVWYEDQEDNKYIYKCDKETKDTCNNFRNSYKYLIYETKECVQKCPDDLRYYFNNKCFSSCDIAKEKLEMDIIKNQTDNEYECICSGFWKYNEQNEKQCLISQDTRICVIGGEESTNYLLIEDTKECYKGNECRKGYKLFNKVCSRNCPSYSDDFQGNDNICQCKYYWYVNKITYLNETICLPQSESCPNEYPNLIVSQRKCVKDGDDELIYYIKIKIFFLF